MRIAVIITLLVPFALPGVGAQGYDLGHRRPIHRPGTVRGPLGPIVRVLGPQARRVRLPRGRINSSGFYNIQLNRHQGEALAETVGLVPSRAGSVLGWMNRGGNGLVIGGHVAAPMHSVVMPRNVGRRVLRSGRKIERRFRKWRKKLF